MYFCENPKFSWKSVPNRDSGSARARKSTARAWGTGNGTGTDPHPAKNHDFRQKTINFRFWRTSTVQHVENSYHQECILEYICFSHESWATTHLKTSWEYSIHKIIENSSTTRHCSSNCSLENEQNLLLMCDNKTGSSLPFMYHQDHEIWDFKMFFVFHSCLVLSFFACGHTSYM